MAKNSGDLNTVGHGPSIDAVRAGRTCTNQQAPEPPCSPASTALSNLSGYRLPVASFRRWRRCTLRSREQ